MQAVAVVETAVEIQFVPSQNFTADEAAIQLNFPALAAGDEHAALAQKGNRLQIKNIIKRARTLYSPLTEPECQRVGEKTSVIEDS